ncbi:MAG: glycine betaine/proline transport system substrate-binding protein, partial [Moritella sp.]
DPKPTMYPESPVDSIVTAEFAARAPEVVTYLKQRSFKNAEMNTLLAWMEANQADGDYAMEHFLVENESKWSTWLTPEAIGKVKQAILAL